MKQIYVGATENVYLHVYKDGVATNADALPTYSISIVGSDAAARTGTAIQKIDDPATIDIDESIGTYYFLTEFEEVEQNQTLRVEWSYLVSANTYTRVDYISVVTPYIDFDTIKLIAPAGTTDEEIENAEMFARFVINAYTGVDFSPKMDTITMHGNDKATLVLPYRIERLDSIAVNDEVLWTRDPELNSLGRIISITDTNYGLLSEKYDNVPVWHDFQERAVWNKSYKYAINGLFGWSDIPDEVEYAARILADDYFCRETGWKKRYVEQINASDWRIVFNQKQFQGTGNFFVDQVLNKYRSVGMVLV